MKHTVPVIVSYPFTGKVHALDHSVFKVRMTCKHSSIKNVHVDFISKIFDIFKDFV